MTAFKQQYWLPVDWPAHANVKAVYTTRYAVDKLQANKVNQESDQETDYSDFNLALHVGDEPNRVLNNRSVLKDSLELPSEPIWLEQIHSSQVVNIDSLATSSQFPLEADGSYTHESGKVCCVMTADCLPVLLSNRQGNWVAAVHAGWRGLANGIIENAIAQYSGASDEIIAWLGPAISQNKFEVGEEVKQEFVQRDGRFESAFKSNATGKYLANLYQIANFILTDSNIKNFGGSHCTYQESDKFFSYRRHPKTGRMASLIWINR